MDGQRTSEPKNRQPQKSLSGGVAGMAGTNAGLGDLDRRVREGRPQC